MHLSSWLDKANLMSTTFTTITNWWGSKDWLEVDGQLVDNSKRSAFLRLLSLPSITPSLLELPIPLSENEDVTSDLSLLRSNGWPIRHVDEVSYTPDSFRSYVHSSRGELSCLKQAYSF